MRSTIGRHIADIADSIKLRLWHGGVRVKGKGGSTSVGVSLGLELEQARNRVGKGWGWRESWHES